MTTGERVVDKEEALGFGVTVALLSFFRAYPRHSSSVITALLFSATAGLICGLGIWRWPTLETNVRRVLFSLIYGSLAGAHRVVFNDGEGFVRRLLISSVVAFVGATFWVARQRQRRTG